ncbi:hypothetical protein D3C83_17410 [compost metagenome]
MLGSWSMRAFSFRAIASVTFFSWVPPRPIAPGSSPPCPGSIATMIRRAGAMRVPGGASAGAASGGDSEGAEGAGMEAAAIAARSAWILSRKAIRGSFGTTG